MKKTLHHTNAIYIMVDIKTSPWVYHLFQTCKNVLMTLPPILSRLVLTHLMYFRGFEDEHQSRYCAPIVSFLHFCHGSSLSSRVQWPLLQRVEFVSFNSSMIVIRQIAKCYILHPQFHLDLLDCSSGVNVYLQFKSFFTMILHNFVRSLWFELEIHLEISNWPSVPMYLKRRLYCSQSGNITVVNMTLYG